MRFPFLRITSDEFFLFHICFIQHGHGFVYLFSCISLTLNSSDLPVYMLTFIIVILKASTISI